MWRVILLTALLQVTWGYNRPQEPIRGPVWQVDVQAVPLTSIIKAPKINKQRLQPYITEQNLNQPFQRQQRKRAFSIFTRLRPFTEIARQRTSIRNIGGDQGVISPISDFDIVSAETRAMFRPIGQPLRWG